MSHTLEPGDLRRLLLQRRVSALLAPLLAVIGAVWMRSRGWKLSGAEESRALFQRLRLESRQPIMICANHLTMVDSFLVAWALGGAFYFVRHPGAFPWNTPEARNFAHGPWQRALAWLARCLPVTRGGDREGVSRTLAQVGTVLEKGDPVLMFPEGGRSRTGRVDPESGTWGVGRLVRSLSDCRVLCVYLRGEGQETWSALPARGDRFRIAAATVEPKAEGKGIRASVELARQITRKLAELESQVLAETEPSDG